MTDTNEDVAPNIQSFWDFFGGTPDDDMSCEYIPCSEVKEIIDSRRVSHMVMPLMEYIQSDWTDEVSFAEYQRRNREILGEWRDILADRLDKLSSDDSRILYRYDLVTIPDTFRVDLRLAAIPTLRGVLVTSWTAVRFNDETKKPLMISPLISLLADEGQMVEEDVALIQKALAGSPENGGDAGRALAQMLQILNKPRIVS